MLAKAGSDTSCERRHNVGMDPVGSWTSTDADNAFTKYVEPEIPILLRVARTLTTSQADAEDLVQETLIRAYRFLDRFDGSYPRAWLLTILRNTASNMRRKSRPDLIEDWDAIGDPRPAFGVSHQDSTESLVMRNQLDGELAGALAELNEKYRRAVLLVDVHGLTYAECAEALGIPIGTVMSRLSRGRAQLRKALKASGRLG